MINKSSATRNPLFIILLIFTLLFVGHGKSRNSLSFNSGKTAVKDGPAARSAMWSQINKCQLSIVFH